MNTIKIDVPAEVNDMVTDPIGKIWVALKKLEIAINNNLDELKRELLTIKSSIGTQADNIEELEEEIKAIKEAMHSE